MIYKFDYQYFGNVNYYFELINCTHYIFELYDAYQKMSFRNRCRILGANGSIDLSIPVVGGRENKSEMNEVKICYREDWRSRHLKTLISCYNRSPWFQEYLITLENLYLKKIEYLYEWDNHCHEFVCHALNLKIKTIDNTNQNTTLELLTPIESRSENMVDMRGKFLPRQPNPFGIEMKPYPQVFSDRLGFVSDLSILDLIFCEGPGAFEILKSSARKAYKRPDLI